MQPRRFRNEKRPPSTAWGGRFAVEEAALLTKEGIRVCRWAARTGFKRHSQTTGQQWQKRVWWVIGEVWYLADWLQYRGWWILKRGVEDGFEVRTHFSYPRPKERTVVKKRTAPEGARILSMLSTETVLLKKLPRLVEALTCVSYEDGTPRTPWYLTLRNKLSSFEVTLYDPDIGHRLALRAARLDDVLLLAEKAVDTEGLPWEPDNYLLGLLEEKEKKKSSVRKKK